MTDAPDSKGWLRLTGEISGSSPLTMEKIEAAFKAMLDAPYKKSMRIVSHRCYEAAKKAEAEGATDREIEMVLMGMTLEQARKAVAQEQGGEG